MNPNKTRQNIIRFILVAIIVTFFSGCKKFNVNDQTTEETIENLVIPSDFSWNTNHPIRFIIIAENSQVIKITSMDGQGLYHKGFYNTLSETYEVNVNLPVYVTEVMINNQPITIQSPITTINLNQITLKSVNQIKTTTELDGLISYWNFNENTGSLVNDLQGSNNGTFSGADWSIGINGTALNFNGDGGKVTIPYHQTLDLTNNNLSISLWIKKEHAQDDGAFIYHRVKYVVRIDKWGKLTFAIYNPEWSDISINWNDRIIDTDWHHIVTTYDGSMIKIYLDGNLMASEETSGNLHAASSDIYIGNQATTNDFEGTIDEVKIYNTALTIEEINQIYATTPNISNGSQNLISKWDLNEGAGTIASDAVGENNGNVIGADWISGITGTCLTFDGESDYVTIPNNASLNFTNKLTIMAWAKTHEYKEAKIAQKGDWDGHGIGITKWNGWKGHIRLDSESSVSIESSSGRPILDKWYHIAITYDGTSLNLYINGQLNNSKSVTGLLKVNSRNAAIGSDNGGQKFFNGLIDDVMFFNAALSQTEIQSIFNTQTTANDNDGDGIPDNEDDYPDDPARAFNNFYPASNYGSLAFEDLWPGKGDYDFNDLVLDYRFTLVTNASNKISDIKADFIIKAIGAGFSNGFGFQLPNSSIQNDYLNISGYNLQENYITLNENGTESGQEKITVIVFDNAKSILQASSGFGVNVTPIAPYITPDTIGINLNFNTNIYTAEDIDIQNFDPFLIIDGERGKEIHLPDMTPTNLANPDYFGTLHDDSNPSNNRYYKTVNNLPWGINIPESFNYTNEKAQIISGHLKFGEWAESGGTQFTDWYKNKIGYRNESLIYQIPN